MTDRGADALLAQGEDVRTLRVLGEITLLLARLLVTVLGSVWGSFAGRAADAKLRVARSLMITA
jgi:hypothetical protein